MSCVANLVITDELDEHWWCCFARGRGTTDGVIINRPTEQGIFGGPFIRTGCSPDARRKEPSARPPSLRRPAQPGAGARLRLARPSRRRVGSPTKLRRRRVDQARDRLDHVFATHRRALGDCSPRREGVV